MRLAGLIIYGLLWSASAGVLSHQFQASWFMLNVPIAMIVFCAARNTTFGAYLIAFILAWTSTSLAGGGRGPILLAYLVITVFLVLGRSRLRTHSISRLALDTVAATMVWSVLFAFLMGVVGEGGWWKNVFILSPMRAIFTGLFAFVSYWIFGWFEPRHASTGVDYGRLRSR